MVPSFLVRKVENEGRDPFNQNSNRSDREKRTTSKGGPVFSKLFRLDRTDPLSFGPKFPESLVEWIASEISLARETLVNEPDKYGETIVVVLEHTKRIQEMLFADWAQ